MAEGGQCPYSPRSLDVIGDVTAFEEALRKNRDFIVKNLNVMNLLISPVSFKDIISEDEQGKIRSCYESSMVERAAEMFIGALLRSKDETKWSVFKEALKRSEGLELIKDILCKGETEALISHESEQVQIRLQRGLLADQWEAELVGNALLEKQVLTFQEYEEVEAKNHTHGNMAANHLILTLVARKKNFFPILLTILWKLGKKKCVKAMDSDFYIKMVENEIPSDSNIEEDPGDNDNPNDNGSDDIGVNIIEHYESMPYNKGNNSFNNAKEYHSVACDGRNYAANYSKGYENTDKRSTENKMDCFNNFNIITQDDNEPVASRTRSKTKLLQMRDSDENLPKQPVVDYRSPGTSHKPMKTLPDEQGVTQYPVLYSSAASKQCVQFNGATFKSHLQKEKTQTNLLQMRDADETLLKQPALDHRPSGTSHKPREILPAEQAVIQYPVHYSSGASEPYVQYKDTGSEGRLHEDNRQTQLLQLKHCNETVQMLPAFDQRQPGASNKPRETLPAGHVVFQHPISHPTGAIRKCLQGKDAAEQANLQENNRQTKHGVPLVRCLCDKRFVSEDALRKHQSTDCQMILGHEHDKTSPRLVRCVCDKRFISEDAMRKHQSTDCQVTLGHDKTSPRLVRCVCDKRFISEDALRKHQSTDCQVTLGHDHDKTSPRLVRCVCDKRFISEDALRKHQSTDCQVTLGHDHDKISPLASHKNGATFRSPDILCREYSPSHHINADNEKSRACEVTGSQRGYLSAVKTSPQAAQQQNTHGRKISSDEKKTPLRSNQSPHQKPGTIVKAILNRQSNERTAGVVEPDYRKRLRKCPCGKIFMSEAHLKEHKRKECPEISQLANQTDKDEHSVDTRTPYGEDELVILEQNMRRARTESLDNSALSDGATSNVLRNTITHNNQSTEDTHQNTGAIESTQETASAGGFGFQSSKTLELHKKP